MKIRTLFFSAQALALGTLLTASPSSFAAEASGDKTTAKDVSRKAGETGRAIKDYTVAHRDEALKQAKAALHDPNAHIRRMQRKLYNQSNNTHHPPPTKPPPPPTSHPSPPPI